MHRLSPTAPPSLPALPSPGSAAKQQQTPRKALAVLNGSNVPGAAEAPVVRVFHDDEEDAVDGAGGHQSSAAEVRALGCLRTRQT